MKSIKLLLILFFVEGYLLGQPSTSLKFLPVLAPPSPEASSFTKYGNYDVNMFTGIPDISIPLYEIKIGELTVPITLNYHASGIKVTDIPSRVGLGWDLQAGGSITRKIMAKPDELPGNYLDQTPTSDGRVKTQLEIDKTTQAGLQYLEDVYRGINIHDVEPDIFSYHFPGHLGKFMFNQKDNYKPFLIPTAPILVNYSKPTQSTLALNMKDENGTAYNFGSTESTTSTGGNPVTATSSWLLTDMTSANQQDNIHFTYAQGGVSSDSYFTDYLVLNDNCSGNQYSPDFGTFFWDYGSITTSSQQLTQIDFKNGKVVFEASADSREDLGSQYNLQNKLNDIKIYSYTSSTNTYTLIRTIQFSYSYFKSGTDIWTKRLKLNSIQILSSLNDVIQNYSFDYNTSISLPTNISRMKDYWGYYNNRINHIPGTQTETMVPRMEVDYTDGNSHITYKQMIGGDNINARDPDPNYMQAYILQKITYPTGGYTQFTYETNKFLDDAGISQYAGGLRIASISSYVNSSSTPIIKTYRYGVNESGYGRNNFDLTKRFFFVRQDFRKDHVNQAGTCDPTSTKTSRTFFANPTNDIEGYDGAPVVYPIVTEYSVNGTTTNGKTVYTFLDRPDAKTDIIGLGKPFYDSYHFIRGLVTHVAQFKSSGGGNYTLIKEEGKGYQFFPMQWTTGGAGLVVNKKTITQSDLSQDNFCALSFYTLCDLWNDVNSYEYNNYEIVSGDNKMINDTLIIYDQNDASKSVATITNYSYDDITHLQLSQTQTINSKNQSLISINTYPYNYSIAPYTSMTANHIFSKIISTSETNNGNPIAAQYNNYSAFSGNNYLVANIQTKFGINSPEYRAYFNSYDLRGNILEMQKANDIKMCYLWDYDNIYPVAEVTNAAYNQIAYTSFEANGTGNWSIPSTHRAATSITGDQAYDLNFGAVSASFPPGTYNLTLWANSPPTISGGPTVVIGRSYNGFTHYSYKISGTSVNISGSSTIDELRLYPTGAQITTYTYIPLIGMTSKCDINNSVTYFSYDAIGRVSLIKDHDGKIIKKYQYAYQSPNPNNGIACSTSNCAGPDEKCVNGFCEKARRINTSTSLIGAGQYAGKWQCNYYYRWTDNTTLPLDADANHSRLQEYKTTPCDINGAP